jgi:hypothetical protein
MRLATVERFPPAWDPADVPMKARFSEVYPEEVQKKVLANWKSYGF